MTFYFIVDYRIFGLSSLPGNKPEPGILFSKEKWEILGNSSHQLLQIRYMPIYILSCLSWPSKEFNFSKSKYCTEYEDFENLFF